MPVVAVAPFLIPNGSPVDADELSANIFQSGRRAGALGINVGGLEVLDGQIDLDNFNFNNPLGGAYDLFTTEQVRRGAFNGKTYIGAMNANRDIVRYLQAGIGVTDSSVYVPAQIPAIGTTWKAHVASRAVEISWNITLTVATGQEATDTPDKTLYSRGAWGGLFVNGYWVKPYSSWFRVGRAANVPSDDPDNPYNNDPIFPDVMWWTGSVVLDNAFMTTHADGYDLADSPVSRGFHTAWIGIAQRMKNTRLRTCSIRARVIR